MRPQSRNDFKIAIICALSVEFDAVEALLDEHYESYGKQRGDLNFYQTGRIEKYNTVLVSLPEIGKRSAASVASSLLISFPAIDLAILTGICGGVPFPSAGTELILGDVIISSKVAEYDFGKLYPDGFQQKGDYTETLGRADRDIRSFLSALKTRRLQYQFQERHLNHLSRLKSLDNRWQYPGAAQDQLFEATYRHKHRHQTAMTTCICTNCTSNEYPMYGKALESDCNQLGCTERLIKRNRLTARNPSPRMHFGTLGSGDTVMKSGEHRDKMVERTGIIGFEMEGVGICDSLRCVIIKGVSDYADSHKNKIWQEYAAGTAASCTKAFLEVLWETMQNGTRALVLLIYRYVHSDDDIGEDRTDHTNRSLQNETSLAHDNSANGQDGYQWEFSSKTPGIDNIDHHIKALEDQLRQLKKTISSPILREVLISGASEAIRSNPDAFRRLQSMRRYHSSSYKTRFGTFVYQTKVAKQSIIAYDESSMRYKTTTSFIFHPASWLIRIGLKCGIEATAVNSQTGWQYSISPVRAVQDDALIFQFCKTGNIAAVSELLKRDASVLDVDSRGWRPLHVSISRFLPYSFCYC
jgi:nucleoside phosphorylase